LVTRRHLRIRFGNTAHPAVEALTVDISLLLTQHRGSGSDIRIRGMPARFPTLPPAVADWQLSERLFHSPAGRQLWITLYSISPHGVTIRECMMARPATKADEINR